MAPLAALGLCVLVLNVISPIHRPLRRLCRPWLSQQVQQQLAVVAWVQQWTHPVMDKAVLISAATVTLEFYLTLLPVMAWFGYPRQVAVLVALMAVQGQAVFGLKDLLESPRPADCIKTAPGSLHITIRDTSGDVEDGLPSAHCSGSVVLLLHSISAAADAGWVGPGGKLALQAAAAMWIAWIAFGRLYLAVHSPVDLASGCILGACILALWQQHLEQPYISWLQHSPHLLLHVAITSFVIMRLFPMPSRPTSPYGYCTAWLAGWAGVVIGYRMTHPIDSTSSRTHPATAAAKQLHPTRQLTALPLWQACCVMAVKVVVGLALCASTRIVVKECMLWVLGRLFEYVPIAVRCLWQPPVVGCSKYMSSATHDSGSQGHKQHHGEEWSQHHNAKAPQLHRRCPSKLGSVADTDQNKTSTTCSTSIAEESKPCDSMWVLRHAPNGMANDVIATARFVSYAALGFAVTTLDLWWQPLQSKFLYASSMA